MTSQMHGMAFVVACDSDFENLDGRLSQIAKGAGPCQVLALVPETLHEELGPWLRERHPGVRQVDVRSVSITHVARALAYLIDFHAFAFAGARKAEGPLDLRWLPKAPRALAPWPPGITIPADNSGRSFIPVVSWLATRELLKAVGEHSVSAAPADFDALGRVAESLDDQFGNVFWGSAVAAGAMQVTESEGDESRRRQLRAELAVQPRPLHKGMSVCAVIPHFQCESYLPRAIRSLLQQTHAPDEIIVLHDGPEAPPLDIVRAFPGVTLLASVENVGPYRLVQSLINATRFDAYMLQDADDFSTVDRLSSTLDYGGRYQAELVGTQELRLFLGNEQIAMVAYPIQAHLALAMTPGRPILHPSSLISRSLLEAIGGFAMGMRFSGDTEMHFRAFHVARMVNSPVFGYVRRIRPGSLTTAHDTGVGTVSRNKIWEQTDARYACNMKAAQKREMLDLAPMFPAPDIQLLHLAGPKLF